MKAGEVVLQHLLNGSIQYRVPLFQRTYSWEERHWERLWDDLLDIYAMERPRNHFIGSIVTQPIPDAPERAAKFILIDGQQRLTTLFIILALIKREAAASGVWPGLPDEIQDMWLTNKWVQNEDEKLKLRPTQRDRLPFAAALAGETLDGSTQIGKAWGYFQQVIKKGDAQGVNIDLRKLKNVIVSYLDLVSIKLEQDDSPNRIFESLNNTGMRLSVSDLIRNFLFMSIPDESRQEQAYQNLWYPMEQRLRDNGGDLLSDFFWRYLMIDGRLPRWDETFNGIKELLDNPSPEETIKALERFSRFSKYYCRLAELERSESEGPFIAQMRRLNQWEVKVAYPFLMAALDHFNSGDITEPQFVEVCGMIESFVLRRTICWVPSNRLRSLFAQMSSHIDYHNFVDSSHTYLIDNQWPEDTEFKEALLHFRLYLGSRLDRTRLILTSLERSFGHKETPAIGPNITIEHIMPQTLGEQWKEALGGEFSAAQIHGRWLDTIGNLTLSGYNPDLGNRMFAEKKRMLLDSNLALSKGLQEYEGWDGLAIEKRGKELAERAALIWRR